MVRDQALAISGLLVEQVGGKSVKPYQPEGLWETVGYTSSNTARFKQDHGAALYRRSIYTFWKRTSPPPSFQIFDAPSREVCIARRARTNTPGQALVVMNDIQYVEAARKMAERVVRQPLKEDRQRIDYAFRLATAQHPDTEQAEELLGLLSDMRAEFAQEEAAAQALLGVGEAPVEVDGVPAPELAAWTVVTSTILNLDETVTKQ